MPDYNNTPNDATSEVNIQIAILSQYIKDLSFENPYAPESLHKLPPFKMAAKVKSHPLKEGEPIFESSLQFTIEAQHKEQSFDLLELTYAAVVSLQEVPEQHFDRILWVEVPRLLFPFARSIIAQLSTEGGYPPILINPVDFATLYARQVGALTARSTDASDPSKQNKSDGS